MAYPVFTLPFEIIAQIFVYCLPPEDDALPWRTEAPLLLAAICREWRATALTTPELWATVYLSLRPHSVRKVTPMLKFWLPRAGGLPLSISLRYNGTAATDHLRSLGILGDLLKEHAPHWNSIELTLPFSALLSLSAPDRALASLKKLSLNCESWLPAVIPTGFVFSKAPQLRELHMISGAPTFLDLPWEQLTTLRLDNSISAECLRTLALVPNLVNFTVMLWAQGPATSMALPLSQLESLTFTLSHTRGPALLQFLTLPALRYLHLDLQGFPEIASVTSLIARSPSFVRCLSVRLGPNWTADHFMQLFPAFDFLEELEIRKAGTSLDTGLDLLKAQPHLLPSLRSMSIERTLSYSENVELLADLLESRWRVPATVTLPVQMKSFRLDSPLAEVPDAESEAFLRLAGLRAEGMDIQIRSSLWSWFP
ncbi:hypothetical protein C8R45DRAFT_387774 [Mycena sanguinolenta]|nr:hypothetical protein C8R45DRAFT_387774 [Mycena sanguinolenta]